MLQAFFNIWRIKELRNKLLFTMSMLVIYRIGFFIPLPGVDQSALNEWAESAASGAVGNLISYVGIFTGGSLSQSTIFGLGIMPYISAAIIFQLLASVSERLKAIQKEGPAGRQKIQEYTRYATLGLCLVQSAFWLSFLQQGGEGGLVYANYRGTAVFWACGVLGLTAGTIFLMWLGEQIDKYGIGNGISLIITAGIIASMPGAITQIVTGFSVSGGDAAKPYGIDTVIFLVVAFIVVVAGSIVITQGQRRIPIQQAKHTRGRRVYGGQKSYLPLRVNHGGVMPIIFASSLMIFPSMLFNWTGAAMPPKEDAGAVYGFFAGFLTLLQSEFANMNGYLYALIYIGLIYFFAYFWTTVQFQPKEMATQLRDNGSFIPGLRPGPRTADYLEIVMERITYVGAGFLAVIAVIPTIVSGLFGIPFTVTQFLGGTGLLIVVSVMLDFVQRIEANLMMRNYSGFLGGGGPGGGGPKIRGARGGA
ncbi:preprotein translocase subunit SecY [Algisphaera agarilytica]|uniref:Protein translocase subunit SecY n=1 Tax=Algisphaera agarilytica TaxID=1385975 RepID=A0A7X0H847_9BACT|nr:preprotein translocase subunit SecY [Algisphaera agarilytica]MBB6431045.1 preprotein translocase subunit SecY [Algisphaera agarilytica]